MSLSKLLRRPLWPVMGRTASGHCRKSSAKPLSDRGRDPDALLRRLLRRDSTHRLQLELQRLVLRLELLNALLGDLGLLLELLVPPPLLLLLSLDLLPVHVWQVPRHAVRGAPRVALVLGRLLVDPRLG